MKDLIKYLQNNGAKAAAVIALEDIVFREEFRRNCEMNACGKYNTNWGCPPACGEIGEMMAEAKQYQHALVYQTVTALEDSFDYEGMQAGKKYYNGVTDLARAEFARRFPGRRTMFWNAGACKNCERCAKLDDQPCRFPEKRTVSMEAYGVDVTELAKLGGMNYINGENTVTYFGALLYND